MAFLCQFMHCNLCCFVALDEWGWEGRVIISEALYFYILCFCFTWKLAWRWHLIKVVRYKKKRTRGAIFRTTFVCVQKESLGHCKLRVVFHFLLHYAEHIYMRRCIFFFAPF